MKNVLSILISVLVLSGCLSLNTYVDPNYSHASYEDVRSIPQKYDVQTVVEFQRDGKPLERANKEVLGHVDRTLRATGVIIPTRDASNISLKVIVNNIPKSGAAASGFLTGLTFGAVGTLATDYYEVTVVYKDNQGAAITKNYKHALHTTIGNVSAPFPDVQPTSTSDGFATIIEQVLLSFVTDMQNNDFLTNSPNTGQLVKLAPKETPDIDSESNSGEMVSAIEYYGEAEEEVNTKSYDKNLWARALVEAEGDEQKRKAKYIELRGNQLYSENVSSISKSNLNEQPVPGTDISGTYISEITSDSRGKFFRSKSNRSLVITIKQDGNNISATDKSNFINIVGTKVGDTIEFYFIASRRMGSGGGNEIDGVWKVNADASRFEGKWKTSGHGGASGKWNLTKIE